MALFDNIAAAFNDGATAFQEANAGHDEGAAAVPEDQVQAT
jgi:hypothetical protein